MDRFLGSKNDLSVHNLHQRSREEVRLNFCLKGCLTYKNEKDQKQKTSDETRDSLDQKSDKNKLTVVSESVQRLWVLLLICRNSSLTPPAAGFSVSTSSCRGIAELSIDGWRNVRRGSWLKKGEGEGEGDRYYGMLTRRGSWRTMRNFSVGVDSGKTEKRVVKASR